MADDTKIGNEGYKPVLTKYPSIKDLKDGHKGKEQAGYKPPKQTAQPITPPKKP